MAAVQKPIPPEEIKGKDVKEKGVDPKAKKPDDDLSEEDKRLQVLHSKNPNYQLSTKLESCAYLLCACDSFKSVANAHEDEK